MQSANRPSRIQFQEWPPAGINFVENARTLRFEQRLAPHRDHVQIMPMNTSSSHQATRDRTRCLIVMRLNIFRLLATVGAQNVA